MRLWQYIRDVLSGRIAHLNATETKSVSEIWAKIERIQEPERIILKHLFVSASLLVEFIITKQSETVRRQLPIEVKKLDLSQFRKLHSLALSYMTFIFYVMNPGYEQALKHSLSQALSDRDIGQRCLSLLDSTRRPKTTEPGSPSWDDAVEARVWGEMATIAGLTAEAGLLDRLLLIGYATELYTRATTGIRKELDLACES